MVTLLLKSNTFVTLALWEQIENQFPSGIITSLMILNIGFPYCQCANDVIFQQDEKHGSSQQEAYN